MKLAALALAGITALVSFSAAASDDFNRTINTVGIQGNSGYVNFKEGVSGGCAYGTVYISSLDTSQGKALYASLLSARATGGKVYHIGYTLGSDGLCTATQLELQ